MLFKARAKAMNIFLSLDNGTVYNGFSMGVKEEVVVVIYILSSP